VADPWFDGLYDCAWFNPRPEWGSLSPSVRDDPELTSTSRDGREPEVITLEAPEAGATYRVGVHVWDDRGHGASLATVRVHVHGELAFEATDVPLAHRDLWWVATITWPVGTVDAEPSCADPVEVSDPPCGDPLEPPRVTPDYDPPEFLAK